MNIYVLIQTYWQLYYSLLFGLLLFVCYGWYLFGVTAPRVAPVQPTHSHARWHWNPSHRFFSWRLGAIAIAGRCDMAKHELAASILVQVR